MGLCFLEVDELVEIVMYMDGSGIFLNTYLFYLNVWQWRLLWVLATLDLQIIKIIFTSTYLYTVKYTDNCTRSSLGMLALLFRLLCPISPHFSLYKIEFSRVFNTGLANVAIIENLCLIRLSLMCYETNMNRIVNDSIMDIVYIRHGKYLNGKRRDSFYFVFISNTKQNFP